MLYESNTGKTRQVVAQLQAEIASGEHGVVGDPFMTVRSLAEAFGISLVTAHRVTTELKRLGILKRVGKRHLLAHRDDLTQDLHCKIGVLVTNPIPFSSLLNALSKPAGAIASAFWLLAAITTSTMKRASWPCLKPVLWTAFDLSWCMMNNRGQI